MTEKETLKAFYEAVIYKASQLAGDTTAIMPVIKRICSEAGITASLDDIAENNRRIQEKELENEREQAAANMAVLVAEYPKADNSRRQEIIKSIQRENITLNKTAATGKRNRFSSWAEYINKCINYDPSKDFQPSMLAGLRFPNGTLSYIGSRPGGGKSTILINIAREALETGRKAFLVNLEMVERTVQTNFILSAMYNSADEAQRKELDGIKNPMKEFYTLFTHESDSRKTFDRLREQAMKQHSAFLENNLFLYDGAGEALETIISEIDSRLNEGDVVLIDYVQRLSPPKNSTDQQYIKIKLISNALLTLALNKKLVIISGAQFGRQTKDSKGKEATMDDFRESGDIEQDAHNAIAIETITDKDGKDTKQRYIKVLKAREGGNEWDRQKFNCKFKYLFITGIAGEYNHKEKNSPGQGQSDIEDDNFVITAEMVGAKRKEGK